MDKLILGLLMLQRLTVYEIRLIIKRNFWGICSDSTGSIQAAIKKLLAAEMIVFTEYVEKSVNKKRYSITEKGRNAFMSWVQTPADTTSATNMELGKLLFMGMVPHKKRIALINETIANTEEELAKHQELQATLNAISTAQAHKQLMEYWEQDPEYHAGIQIATESTNDSENISGIAHYQRMALQYGIDLMKFEIEWFKKLSQFENDEE